LAVFEKNSLTFTKKHDILIKCNELCGCGGTGRRARFRF
jgi:hypothetical protein